MLDLEPDKSKMHSYLVDLYEKIVVPFNISLKRIMIQFCFASEAEVFTSDLHFKMFNTDSESSGYRSNLGPLKHEDACEEIKT